MPSTARAAKVQHVLADTLTFCNLAAGVSAALMESERSRLPPTLIFIGAACDAFDGPRARRSGTPPDSGARADGISDVAPCGAAPAVLLVGKTRADRSPLARLAPRIYLATIAWRVARYGFEP